jgi:hypothetical protein
MLFFLPALYTIVFYVLHPETWLIARLNNLTLYVNCEAHLVVNFLLLIFYHVAILSNYRFFYVVGPPWTMILANF